MALVKTDFGLYGVVGGMMGIEVLACTMRPTATGLPQRNFHHGVRPHCITPTSNFN